MRDDRRDVTLAQDARELVSNIYSEKAQFCKVNGDKQMNKVHVGIKSDSYVHTLYGYKCNDNPKPFAPLRMWA